MFSLCCSLPKVVVLINDVRPSDTTHAILEPAKSEAAALLVPPTCFCIDTPVRRGLARLTARYFALQLTIPSNRGLDREKVAHLVSLINADPKECVASSPNCRDEDANSTQRSSVMRICLTR